MSPPPLRDRPTILLFDVDGTLINAGGAGRRSLERAFLEIVGSAKGLAFDLSGRTDLSIIREGLRCGGVASDDHASAEVQMKAIIAAYLTFLPDEVTTSANYEVFPGVHAVLEAASKLPNIAIGLGTGNLRKGAFTKLDRAGLTHFFTFGGFGSDHEERPGILGIGARRGAEILDHGERECRVVVIGDTAHDVSAALAIDAECVGVGTGNASPEELLACGATCAFATLEEEGAIEAILQPVEA
ncbi:MAG: HAD hydrolase-like protein [Deltaproteobacteria bacterium]|nr:HAD hydrolase-like protein [Deltaproteobacteria bacterium]